LGNQKIRQQKNKRVGKRATKINVRNNDNNRKKATKTWQPEKWARENWATGNRQLKMGVG